MKKVKGYVCCKSTERPLYFPEIIWVDDEEEIQSEKFQSTSGGFFEIDVPEYVNTIYVRNRGYSSEEYKINKNGKTSIIAKLSKNTTYG